MIRVFRCVVYCRVSGESQRDGASLTVQLEDCRRYADKEGWKVVKEYAEVKSGLLTERDSYQDMLALIDTGQVDIVLIWRLDRFGRDDGEGITRCNELDRKKVRLVSATQGELDPMTRGILFVVAKQESRNTSERVHPNIRKRVEEGKWPSRPPFGYRMAEGRKGILVVHALEAQIIREMFRRAGEGESQYSIGAWLNAQQTVRPHQTREFGGAWVRKALSNSVYAGWVEWDRLRRSKIDGNYKKQESERIKVPGIHDPLVDQELFDRVQEMIKGRNRGFRGDGKNSGQFLLTGLVRCGICDKGMYGQWNNYTANKRANRPMTGFIYKCGRKGHPFTNGRLLDQWVLGLISTLPTGERAEDAMRSYIQGEEEHRPNRLADLGAAKTKQLSRRKRLTMLLVDEAITQEDYDAAIEDVDVALDTLDRELAAIGPVEREMVGLEEAAAQLRPIEDFGDFIARMTFQEKARMIPWAIARVEVGAKGTEPWVDWREWAERLRAGYAQRYVVQ